MLFKSADHFGRAFIPPTTCHHAFKVSWSFRESVYFTNLPPCFSSQLGIWVERLFHHQQHATMLFKSADHLGRVIFPPICHHAFQSDDNLGWPFIPLTCHHAFQVSLSIGESVFATNMPPCSFKSTDSRWKATALTKLYVTHYTRSAEYMYGCV